MAILSDLVAALAYVTGQPEATIFAYGRFAREAGLIAQRGRGRGAATMKVRDAANLLIAVGGTGVTREAALAIGTYRSMRGVRFDLSSGLFYAFAEWLEPLGLKYKGEPPKCMLKSDFGTLLEFLILEAGRSDLTRFLLSLPSNRSYFDAEPTPLDQKVVGSDVQLNIVFHRTERGACVEFKRSLDGRSETAFEIWFEPKKPLESKGLRTAATVTQDCLTALGLVLADKIDPKQLRSHKALAKIYKEQAKEAGEVQRYSLKTRSPQFQDPGEAS